MIVVAENSIFTLHYTARIALNYAGDYVQKRRFSRTVVAENSDFLPGCKYIGKRADNRNAVKRFGNGLKFQNFSAQPPALYLKRKAFCFLKFLAVYQLHIPLNASLCLRSACTRSAHKPVAFKTKDALYAAVSILLNFSFNFLFFKISGIIALIQFYSLAVNLKNVRAYCVKKIAVVRYHQHCSVSVAQIVLKPGNCSYVKMISRLVKKEKPRVFNKNLCKRNFFYHSATQCSHFPFHIVNIQSRKDGTYLRFVVPQILPVHLFDKRIVLLLNSRTVTGTEFFAQIKILPDYRKFWRTAFKNMFADCVVLAERRILRQKRNACILIDDYLPFIRNKDSGYCIQKR